MSSWQQPRRCVLCDDIKELFDDQLPLLIHYHRYHASAMMMKRAVAHSQSSDTACAGNNATHAATKCKKKLSYIR
jgi:hypothetical protein